jgi:two-component system chemotaxis response regulator CheB
MSRPTSSFIPQRDADAIVIGGSAGGVQALQALLPALPASFPLPVLVVLHLPAQQRSLLPEVMTPCTALPVSEVLDKQPLQPGCIVFAPADYHLLVEPSRTLALSVDAPVLHSRPAIDPLFESAAAAFGVRLLAVLLTGASEDGCAGLRAVGAAGGHRWVQDPDEAEARLMPQSAIDLGLADEVLTLEAMARRLQEPAQ